MSSAYRFQVLSRSLGPKAQSQRSIAAQAGISLGSVNKAVGELKREGLLDEAGLATEAGRRALRPFRVKSALILAMGGEEPLFSSSFETPRPLLRVRGDVLIERVILQLRDAGVRDIAVAVDSMREQFFYLEDRLGVRLLPVEDTLGCPVRSALLKAGEDLRDCYVVPSDRFYAGNPFRPYMFESSCIAVPDGSGDSVFLRADRAGHAVPASPHDAGALAAAGPVYLRRDDVEAVLDALRSEGRACRLTRTWRELLLFGCPGVKMAVAAHPAESVFRLGSFEDLCAFDPSFLQNLDSGILRNIRSVFQCDEGDICGIRPIRAGMTNLSFVFGVSGRSEEFVYRHPGAGTESIVNRKAEAQAVRIARKLGLNSAFVEGDGRAGWMISRYVSGCEAFDYANREHVRRALRSIRMLHESGEAIPYAFDPYEDAVKLIGILKSEGYPFPRDFPQMAETACRLAGYFRAESPGPVLCHNDFYAPNILVSEEGVCLIDWEYAAMGDYANEIGNFVSQGSGYTVEQARDILPEYFGRKPTPGEVRHCMAAVGIVGFQWYVWAIFKEMKGQSVGDWLGVYYRAARVFGPYALSLYEGEDRPA